MTKLQTYSNKNEYAVLYIRVSTEKESQDGSYEEQYEELEKYARVIGFKILRVYKERVTATKVEGRNQFDEMMRDISTKQFSTIIFKDLSRSARNVEVSARLKRLCLENGVGIFSVTEGAHLELESLNYNFRALMNEHYSTDLSMKIKSRFKSRMGKVEFMNGEPPYAYYVKENKLFVRDDDTPDIVRRIFNEYLEGSGVDGIAKRLTRDGIMTPSMLKGKKNCGVTWHGSTIKKMLENRAYCGDLEQGKEEMASAISKVRIKHDHGILVKDTHEAIISKDLFFEVQQLIESRKKGPRPTPVKHLLTDILICGKCSKKYWYRSIGERYICGSYARHGKSACSAHAVKENELKRIVIEELNDLVKQYRINEKIEEEVTTKIKSKIYSMSSKKKLLVEKMERFDESNASLILSKVTKEISPKEYEMSVSLLEKKMTEAQEELSRLENANLEIDKQKVQKRIKKIFFGVENFNDLDREMLFRFVEKIIVHGKNDYEIVYRFRV